MARAMIAADDRRFPCAGQGDAPGEIRLGDAGAAGGGRAGRRRDAVCSPSDEAAVESAYPPRITTHRAPLQHAGRQSVTSALRQASSSSYFANDATTITCSRCRRPGEQRHRASPSIAAATPAAPAAPRSPRSRRRDRNTKLPWHQLLLAGTNKGPTPTKPTHRHQEGNGLLNAVTRTRGDLR